MYFQFADLLFPPQPRLEGQNINYIMHIKIFPYIQNSKKNGSTSLQPLTIFEYL